MIKLFNRSKMKKWGLINLINMGEGKSDIMYYDSFHIRFRRTLLSDNKKSLYLYDLQIHVQFFSVNET